MADSTTSGSGTGPSSATTNPPSPGQTVISAALLERPPENPEEVRYTGIDLWLHRITMLLFVFVCAVVGVLLILLPWRPEWTDNYLLLSSPGLRAIVASGFVRGICTGLGVLDLWVGFWEAVHYHEMRPLASDDKSKT
jgi:hypothetical protein